jgi:DUF1009 family protein
MSAPEIDNLILIAGKGVYPLMLARAAKAEGLQRLVVIAFRGETSRDLSGVADEIHWLHVGQLGRLLAVMQATGIPHAVMAGQITPTNLFRVRMDRAMLDLLQRLPRRNAATIFGAIADAFRDINITLLPASSFMASCMPAAGTLSARQPTERERMDIALGLEVAHNTSAMEIGQTVVIKEGTIIAVEAFEGTDKTIRRGRCLGGPGTVVVKAAKRGHDMRFDIPVIGERTLKALRRARVAALAVEANRAILLGRERLTTLADRMNLCFTVVEARPNPD